MESFHVEEEGDEPAPGTSAREETQVLKRTREYTPKCFAYRVRYCRVGINNPLSCAFSSPQRAHLINHSTRDMLALPDTVRSIHRKVRKLEIDAVEIVRFQCRIDARFRPGATDGLLCVEHEERGGRVDLEVGFGGGKAGPA